MFFNTCYFHPTSESECDSRNARIQKANPNSECDARNTKRKGVLLGHHTVSLLHGLHCEPVIDFFISIHPFDFKRIPLNSLVGVFFLFQRNVFQQENKKISVEIKRM